MDKGVYVRFRYDGSIFDLRRLSANTKTLNSLIQEVLFVDDCALMAHKPGDLQDQDGGSPNSKATTVWRARAGSQETGPSLQTFQGHSESRLAMVWHPTNWTGCYCSGQTALAYTYTICVICTRGRASPPSTVRHRMLPLSSLYPSDKCELPVPRLCMALQVQDWPAEPLPYPQIRGTDNVILETEGQPWWWWWLHLRWVTLNLSSPKHFWPANKCS